MEQLDLNADHWEKMRSHVEACQPLEGCGLLAGRDGLVVRVLPVRNAAQSPIRFRMDPAGQLSAFRDMDDLGLELLGIFHSHPAESPGGITPPEGPSETDVSEAAYPVVHVIWSRRLGVWGAQGFWMEPGWIRQVPIVIRSSK